jgi:glycosyltransferase involved in cell wall biosynthesis
MKLSILIPFYNREKYLPDALMSIENQSYKDFKVIMYDDGSTDRSLEIAREFQSQNKNTKIIVWERNMGVSHARNQLLVAIDTPYAAWMDSDDISDRNRFSLQMRAIERFNVDILLTDYWTCKNGLFRCKKRSLDITRYKKGTPQELWRNFCFATALFRKRCATVEFNEDKKEGGEDVRWFCDLVQKGFQVGHLPQALYQIRNHEERMTIIRENNRKGQPLYQQFIELTQ